MDAARQRLIFRGKVLADGDSLDAYKLEDGHTLHMVSRPLQRPPRTASEGSALQPQAPPPLGAPLGLLGLSGLPLRGGGGGGGGGGAAGAAAGANAAASAAAARLLMMSALAGGGGARGIDLAIPLFPVRASPRHVRASPPIAWPPH